MHTYERHTLADYGLQNGLGDIITPESCVALWNYKNRRHLEAVFHKHLTGERIWAKTINKGICDELGITDDDLEIYTFAGMMVELDRKEENMTEEEELEFAEQVDALVSDMLENFDYDSFYAEKAAAEAEEAMLESTYREDDLK